MTGDRLHPPRDLLPDAYVEGGLLVYTAAYHLKRGYCCGSGCRHCPYEPRHVPGTTAVAPANAPAPAPCRP
jgi:hypothetical protein